MIKLHSLSLACALGAGSLFGAAAPASAAHISGGTARPAATGRVLPGNRYYGTGYRSYGYPYRYGYRYGYRYPYRYGYGYPYAVGVGVGVGYGYGYVGGGYGYPGGGYGYPGGAYGYAPAPYPAVYGRRAYWAPRPVLRPHRRAWRRGYVR